MLAYVFWHRPAAGVDAGAYEEAQRAFHRGLRARSACFRLSRLPFDERGGYEDWYLVDDWAGLGALNATAVDAGHRERHAAAASLAGEGWGGVYALLRGDPVIPAGTDWVEKPRGEPLDRFLAAMLGSAVWRRQLVLGPAPEFCVAAAPAGRRSPIVS